LRKISSRDNVNWNARWTEIPFNE